jgi:VCBS repeat-containing protein
VASGVLANDSDPDGDTLIASVVGQPANGSVALNPDGSFTYTPDNDFSGDDSFTYTGNDGRATSDVATVEITVIGDGNQLFGSVIPGTIDDPGLLGTRMDTQPGAPPFTLAHVTTAVDYSAFDDAPSYGQHHAFLPGITPRPTGVYETEQPDEDLVHNIEHGHVWISYNPGLVDNDDLLALEQLVRDGGTDTGVIVTPRSKNTSPIVLTSLTRQLTLDSFDATTIRDFVNTNRGHSPEGFILSGQKSDNGESLDDGLPHTP